MMCEISIPLICNDFWIKKMYGHRALRFISFVPIDCKNVPPGLSRVLNNKPGILRVKNSKCKINFLVALQG